MVPMVRFSIIRPYIVQLLVHLDYVLLFYGCLFDLASERTLVNSAALGVLFDV